MMRAYQATLGPLLGGACRFHPSCSAYAVEAIERHGSARGVLLAVKRLAKCHPFSGHGGYDPVPEETAVAHQGRSKQRPYHAPLERAQ